MYHNTLFAIHECIFSWVDDIVDVLKGMPMIYKFHIASCYTLVVLFLLPFKMMRFWHPLSFYRNHTGACARAHWEILHVKAFLGSSSDGLLLLFDGTKESGEYSFKMLNLRGMVQCLLITLRFTTSKIVTYVCLNVHVNKYFHFFLGINAFCSRTNLRWWKGVEMSMWAIIHGLWTSNFVAWET